MGGLKFVCGLGGVVAGIGAMGLWLLLAVIAAGPMFERGHALVTSLAFFGWGTLFFAAGVVGADVALSALETVAATTSGSSREPNEDDEGDEPGLFGDAS